MLLKKVLTKAYQGIKDLRSKTEVFVKHGRHRLCHQEDGVYFSYISLVYKTINRSIKQQQILKIQIDMDHM